MDTLYASLQQEFTRPTVDTTRCFSLLNDLMVHMSAAGLLGTGNGDVNSKAVTRDVLEMGAFLAIRAGDLSAFERYIKQLFPLYYSEKAQSQKMSPLIGLYLLALLVFGRISEFHTHLEKLSYIEGLVESPFIQFSIQLERCLMEGTYHRLALARSQLPAVEYAPLVDRLLISVRYEIANGMEVAYDSIDTSSASQVLLGASQQELAAITQERKWNIYDGKIVFNPQPSTETLQAQSCITWAAPLIVNTLKYANDLEKIV